MKDSLSLMNVTPGGAFLRRFQCRWIPHNRISCPTVLCLVSPMSRTFVLRSNRLREAYGLGVANPCRSQLRAGLPSLPPGRSARMK